MTLLKTSGRCGGCITSEQSLATGGPRETLAGEKIEFHYRSFWFLGCILHQTTSRCHLCILVVIAKRSALMPPHVLI